MNIAYYKCSLFWKNLFFYLCVRFLVSLSAVFLDIKDVYEPVWPFLLSITLSTQDATVIGEVPIIANYDRNDCSYNSIATEPTRLNLVCNKSFGIT